MDKRLVGLDDNHCLKAFAQKVGGYRSYPVTTLNTGNFKNGFSNGYVNTVLSASLQQVP
jgi:hypothetical protein